jgi:hypothetical protein
VPTFGKSGLLDASCALNVFLQIRRRDENPHIDERM